MLTYLTGNIRPDITMVVHQCAQFSTNPMCLREQAVMCIGQYLLSTQDRGMTYSPDPTKGIEVYVDANFAGGWDPGDAMNADNVYSRTEYIIRYAGCSIYWQSKLQTEIALSTAEAEYIELSQALRETLPMTSLLKELCRCVSKNSRKKNHKLAHPRAQPCIKCDFSSLLTITKVCHLGQRG